MAKEIVIDCVVKPILSVAVTMASMVVFGFVSKKIEDRRNKKAEAEREEPEMA